MFDYLGVLLSVVLGLALTNLIFGLSNLIHARRDVRPYWVQIVWAGGVLIYVLAVWWGMFWWRHLQDWRFEQFLFLISYAIVIFMVAAILFPPVASEVSDPERHFFDNRRWFFGLLALALILDVPETLAKQTAGLRDVPTEYKLFLPFALTLAVIGWTTANRRIQAAIAVSFLAAQVSYLTLSSLDLIRGG